MSSRSELRRKSREQLDGGIFKNNWLLMLLICLVADVLISVTGMFLIGLILVVGPITYGLCRCCVQRARGGEANLESLFDGFKDDFSQTVLLGFLSNLFIALWSLLLIIPGIVKTYAYAMAPYIQQDAEGEGKHWKTCLDASRAMMKGYKWKLFLLDLSFLGWYIVGALCLGVGILFVVPYHEMARTNFYEELKANA